MLHWYVATCPVTPLVRETVPFAGAVSGIVHGFGAHVGAEPLHAPDGWHVRANVVPPVLSV
ncbi:MAG: hypothetical protein KF901_19170 [Myxococcales bacterium]|nr:hypothetical protein [Myxococcales bacterium]